MLPRKDLFDLPEGVIYLDGNSLGVLPKSVEERVAETITAEWGQQLIRGWNKCGWMDLPDKVGDRIGVLIGAAPGTVTMGDTLSIKVYQALDAALKLRPDRKVILSDCGNFPTDLYMAQGLVQTIAKGHEIRTPAPDGVADAISEDVAVVILTEVDYSTGRRHNMAEITAKAHAAGALMIWDLAHSAGAFTVKLAECEADFAVGCTYKYLNSGPGGPAFIYVRPDLINDIQPALSGWLGHEAPFAFDLDYRPGMTIQRMRVGTPPILQLAALDAALDVWDGVEMEDVRNKCLALGDLFIAEVEARCPDLTLQTPREHDQRGSQISFAFEHGYAAMQAVIAHGVIGDFRAPNTMRFGITPLYLDEGDMIAAAEVIEKVMKEEMWRDPQYNVRSAVT
ncbi:MAG: kynureninase [Paracoccaceae bacterium]|nr:kynureninase [Paracoccaceae bacterium]MDG1371395.1 kynureninase [Paracoccaceae bacterium]